MNLESWAGGVQGQHREKEVWDRNTQINGCSQEHPVEGMERGEWYQAGAPGALQRVITVSLIYFVYLTFIKNKTSEGKKRKLPFFTYGCLNFVHLASKIIESNRKTIKPFI